MTDNAASLKLKYAILSVEEMAKADQLTSADLQDHGRSSAELMEQAGLCVVREITKKITANRALILCGPGNNGGDGFVIARHLKEYGWTVDVALHGNVKNLKGDALYMQELMGGEIKSLNPDIVDDQDIIVDAIFGTGLTKDIEGVIFKTIEKSNKNKAYKIAVDIPSGIKGNTGEVLGIAFKADQTVTFCRPKPAHFLYPGKSYCGELIVADIGIGTRTIKEVDPDMFRNDPDLWIRSFPKYGATIHKYHRGHAIVVSGDMTHSGASRLCAMAALRIGAGLVSVSSPEDALNVHGAHLTAIMIRKRDQISQDLKDDRINAWCIGPSAGLNRQTRKNTLDIIKAGKNVVLDADALTIFAEGPLELFEMINTHKQSQCVLTPHGGEFARVFPYMKQLDKISAASSAAKLSGSVIIYKGADTVIAAPDGRIVISSNGTPLLATAGTGDVLAGLVTGLLAQHMPAFEAACAAQWIHCECANRFGPGLIAEDLNGLIPDILQQLVGNKA